MELRNFCHTEKSYSLLSESNKKLIDDFLIESATNFNSPYHSKEMFWKVFSKHKIALPPEFYSILEKDDSIEMWTSDREFIFAMGPILKITSYSFEQLLSNHWSELFSRDEQNTTKIIQSFIKAIETNTPQFDVTDYHLVKEVRSSLKIEQLIKIKLIVRVNLPHERIGVISIYKCKNPKPLFSFLKKSCSSLSSKMKV